MARAAPDTPSRKFAVVTGGSSGIGLERARILAAEGHDLLIVSNDGEVDAAAEDLRATGVDVTAVEADLATKDGSGDH
jgi:short-subunit dehydrogenase